MPARGKEGLRKRACAVQTQVVQALTVKIRNGILASAPTEGSVTASDSTLSLRTRCLSGLRGKGRVAPLTSGCCVGVQGLPVRQKRGRSKNDKGG